MMTIRPLSINKSILLLLVLSFITFNFCQAKNFSKEGNFYYSIEDTTTTIEFAEISITISRLVPYDRNIYKVDSDTCFVTSDIFESVLGQRISINYNKLQNLNMEMSYETSVVITNEGPHCDLRDYKHYLSSWKVVKKINDNTFQFNSLSSKEQEVFPKININDLKLFVKMSCGEEWYQLIKNIKSVNEGSSSVGISKVFLKINGTLNGKAITKLLVFYQDLGC